MEFSFQIEKLKSSVIDNLNNPAVILNDNGQLVFTNLSWKKDKPHQRLYKLGESYKSLFNGFPEIIININKMLLGENCTSIYQFDKNNTAYTIEISPIKDNLNCIIGALVIYTKCKDLGRQNHGEMGFFQTIAKYSKDMINVTDSEGNVEYSSPSYEYFLGHTEQSNIFEHTHPDDILTMKLLYKKIVSTKKTSQIELRKKNKNNLWIWIH